MPNLGNITGSHYFMLQSCLVHFYLIVSLSLRRLSECGCMYVGYCILSQSCLQVLKQWERRVRAASSLDELLHLADFSDWKLWKCRLKLQQKESQNETPSSQSTGSHRSTRYAAESYSLEILKAVDEEWQRTQCMPRETCVDVAKELGTDPSVFFKPPGHSPCVSCCFDFTCRNITTVYVNKTVSISGPVLIKVANHTECRCQEPAIIRRNAQPDGNTSCYPVEPQDSKRLCASGLIWDCSADRCIPYPHHPLQVQSHAL
uniref:Vascular endothelial growth factor D n=1 Tax=Neogobius melanostomus TaxID=47308 RepID=A0A8C6UY81_9GOBI